MRSNCTSSIDSYKSFSGFKYALHSFSSRFTSTLAEATFIACNSHCLGMYCVMRVVLSLNSVISFLYGPLLVGLGVLTLFAIYSLITSKNASLVSSKMGVLTLLIISLHTDPGYVYQTKSNVNFIIKRLILNIKLSSQKNVNYLSSFGK